MSRFDRYPIKRFLTEVSVPGYDVQRAVASTQKQQKRKRRRAAARDAPESQPAQAPLELVSTAAPATREENTCPDLPIDL